MPSASPPATAALRISINGREHLIHQPDPSLTLAEYLRAQGLTGTKLSCVQGGCGACSVILTRKVDGEFDHRPVNACIRPLVSCDGCAITTTEGLGSTLEGMDPLQAALAKHNGSQCGFCTPGFVTTGRAFLAKNPTPTREQIEGLLGGNLCRCTGYRPIFHALRQFAVDRSEGDTPLSCRDVMPPKIRETAVALEDETFFRPEAAKESAGFASATARWERPASVAEALALHAEMQPEGGRYVLGCTSFAIRGLPRPAWAIDLAHIPALQICRRDGAHFAIGAAVSLQDFLEFLTREAEQVASAGGRILREMATHGSRIAGWQIRGTAALGGNLMSALVGTGLISDLLPGLCALEAQVLVHSANFGERGRALRLADLAASPGLPPDALLERIEFSVPMENEFLFLGRVARKRQMSHPIVVAALRCAANGESLKPGQTQIFLSGMGGGCRALTATAAAFSAGSLMNETSWLPALEAELEGDEGVVDGLSAAVRHRLAKGLLRKLQARLADALGVLPAADRSALPTVRKPCSGRYEFPAEESKRPLATPMVKAEGYAQACGETRFTFDESPPVGGLFAALILSGKAHAKFHFPAPLQEIEQDLQRRFPGFETLVTVADIPGSRFIGPALDEPLLAEGEVLHHGARIGLVVATTLRTAREAARCVEEKFLVYEELPAVITLDEAIANGELLPRGEPGPQVFMRAGTDPTLFDDEATLPAGWRRLRGRVETGHQAHFGLEMRSALAIPGREGELRVFNCTQFPSGEQSHLARVLDVPMNKVTVEVSQVGGGFGSAHHGSAQFAAMAAVAARKVRRPVKLETTREENMKVIGKRHPFRGTYTVLYREDGEILGMDLDFESNGGCTTDASWEILGLGSLLADNCYHVPHLRVSGRSYRSNITTNTAFRSFGQVQSHLIVETAVQHVAHALRASGIDLPPEDIRRRNFYRSSETREDSEKNHVGQPLGRVRIREQFDQLFTSCEFAERRGAAEAFNRENRWHKRGLAILPMKYGIGLKHIAEMKSGSALVNVNRDDGSVTLNHGGVEMGQGLNQRLIQLAAYELDIPPEWIHIARTNTDAIANAPATAASSGFDINGGAVALACRKLKNRLLPVWQELVGSADGARPGWAESWKQVVDRAFCGGVRICAGATFAMRTERKLQPGEEMGPDMFTYFVYGFTASEVELDVLTGEYTILRTDILFDMGRAPSPAVDFGQIEGGFVQGVGLGTCEELRYEADGRLATDNIWSYELPCSKSIPIDLRITLAETPVEVLDRLEEEGRIAVAGSKATGEPGVSIGNSVFFALREALIAARAEFGQTEWPNLDAPATTPKVASLINLAGRNTNQDSKV